MFAYVGCYTTPDRDGEGNGVSVWSIDQNGDWTQIQVLDDQANPSFLILSPDGRHLYTVHGGDHFHAVSCFSRDPHTGSLTYVNSVDCGGANPVHLDVDSTGRWLAVANYTSGSLASVEILPDGSLGSLKSLVNQEGETGPHPVEQTGPHAHHCPFDAQGINIIVPDKGLDRVFLYRVDEKTGRLSEAGTPAISRPGAGPRHAAFSPDNRFCYVVNELDSTISVYDYDAEGASLDLVQLISTLPAGFPAANTGSEIELSASGEFLYASNRGHNSIAAFSVDRETGKIKPIGWDPTGGSVPRFFALTPDGTKLFVGNQGSHTIVEMDIDPASGLPKSTGRIIQTGSPSCIVFAERE